MDVGVTIRSGRRYRVFATHKLIDAYGDCEAGS